MTDNTATTRWSGDLASGQGELTLDTSGAATFTISLSARIEATAGRTNPEELAAAAHSACLAINFAAVLAEHDLVAESTDTSATVSMGKTPDGFAITGIALRLDARVAGLEEGRFQELAAIAEKTCPMSMALSATPITLAAHLVT